MFSSIYNALPSFSFFKTTPIDTIKRHTDDETIGEDWVDIRDNNKLIDFTEKSPLPTAYSQSMNTLKYDDSNPLGTSSHDVFIGEDNYQQRHFIKLNHNPAMVYCEAFLGHLYSLSLLYGVAPGVARHNYDKEPIAISSKELTGFKTFKDEPLTLDQLNDTVFRKRFTQILAVFFRMHEDDGHHGNITTNLQTFDADCAFWDATYLIKGGRPNVDNFILRNPDTAFTLTENDITQFPDISNSALWYFPSQTNYYTGIASTNPWSKEATDYVKTLKNNQETLAICFEEYLDWMLDLSIRFESIAVLNIPSYLNVNETGLSIIQLYCNTNEKINKEYWTILPTIPTFVDFINHNGQDILSNILVKAHIRNQRLIHDKQLAHHYFKQQFDNALINPLTIIKQFNELANIVTKKTTFCASQLANLLKTEIIKSINIDTVQAKQLIEKSIALAEEIMALEKEIGTEDWKPFSQFFSTHTPTITLQMK